MSDQPKEKSDVQEQVKENGQSGQVDISVLLDVPLQVTVELGRTRMTIEQLLKLNQGSVVELNRIAGEPLDIYVNSKLVARGEAVVVKEKFGIRIIDVVSHAKRLESLQ